uniref:DELLA protein GAI1-like n=1 Tax=Erigeron canadensis TaxID=72917 RepID=UPI001CB8FC34|nr:DELLA protein GAI1-like [Erigeron canadensis]
MIEDMLDFNVNLLELNDDEQVAVYSPFRLSYLIVRSNRLEHLMREIRKINPCITLISEVEANHTSPAFVNRFIEALFFYGALFDSMSDQLADSEVNKKFAESVFYGEPIRNIVAAEGEERTVRHVGIDVWRAFFARFGMLEVELSDACLNEAKLLINNFDCANSCMLRVDGKCFLVGWKGVPIFSVSAWKFVR